MFSAIPKAVTFFILVETATKCFAIASSLADFKNQAFNVFALESVSCVVNVFETITNNVVSGFNFFKALQMLDIASVIQPLLVFLHEVSRGAKNIKIMIMQILIGRLLDGTLD